MECNSNHIKNTWNSAPPMRVSCSFCAFFRSGLVESDWWFYRRWRPLWTVANQYLYFDSLKLYVAKGSRNYWNLTAVLVRQKVKLSKTSRSSYSCLDGKHHCWYSWVYLSESSILALHFIFQSKSSMNFFLLSSYSGIDVFQNHFWSLANGTRCTFLQDSFSSIRWLKASKYSTKIIVWKRRERAIFILSLLVFHLSSLSNSKIALFQRLSVVIFHYIIRSVALYLCYAIYIWTFCR